MPLDSRPVHGPVNGRFEHIVCKQPHDGYGHLRRGHNGRSTKREVTALNVFVKELTGPTRQLIPNAV